jgi:hypothetical protein
MALKWHAGGNDAFCGLWGGITLWSLNIPRLSCASAGISFAADHLTGNDLTAPPLHGLTLPSNEPLFVIEWLVTSFTAESLSIVE